MNIRLLSTYLTLGVLTVAPLFSQTDVDSNISEVILYQGNAKVIRVAEVEVTAGENILMFHELPSFLNAQQVNLGTDGGVAVRLDNLSYKVIDDREDSELETGLKSEIEGIEKAVEALLVKQRILQRQINYAGKLSSSFAQNLGKESIGENFLEQADALWNYEAKATQEANDALVIIVDELEEHRKKLTELAKELVEETNTINRLQGMAEVRLFAKEAGVANLSLSYLVSDSGWSPTYAVRVDTSSNSMELVYQAELFQNTGESWEDVQLIVSTSQPNRFANAPVLNDQYLNTGWAGGYKESMKFERSVVMAAPPADSMMVDGRSDKDYSSVAQTKVGFSSFSASLPSRVTLESKRETSRFPILTKNFEAEFWSEVVPAMQERGFLKGKTSNVFNLPLLAGQAQVFIDGDLTARVTMPYVLPEDEFELSLGADELIIVSRKEVVRETEYSGLIDKTTELKRAYSIEVSNFHPLTHKVKVFDRFPVSQNEKITVKRKLPDSDDVSFEKEESGVFFWEFEMKAKEEKALRTEFEVVHPREWHVEI